MPDQVTCVRTPRDQHCDVLAAGTQYLIYQYRVLCFEGDDGTLYVQKCTRLGSALPGSTPQRVDALPSDARPFRVEVQ